MATIKMNVRKGTTENQPLGQLTELLGKDATFGLYSERNFTGDARVLISAWEKDSDSPRGDYKFTCDEYISKDLRSAKNEQEFFQILDSLAYANVTMEERPATKRNGELMFDRETGEQIVDTIYYLAFSDNQADVSNTVRKLDGKATKRETKRSVFSFEKAIAGLV
jgi:hypothetical protein